MKRSSCIITVLCALSSAGCMTTPLVSPVMRPAAAPAELGNVKLTVRWPSSRLAQAMPFATNRLTLTVESAAGEAVAQSSLEQGQTTVSMELPTGTGYKLRVRADAATQANIAGAEAIFSVLRNRNTDLAVELSPVIRRFAGSPDAAEASQADRATLLNQPDGIWWEGRDLLVANNYNNTIVRIDPTGNIGVIAGGGNADLDSEPLATQALLSNPTSILTDLDGNIWLQTDFTRLCVIPKRDGEMYGRMRQAGRVYPILTGNGIDPEVYFIGSSMALDSDGRILLTSGDEGLVYRLSAASAATASLTPIIGKGGQPPRPEGTDPLAAYIGSPVGLAVDQDGNIAVASDYPAQVTVLCKKAGRIFGMDMQAGQSYRLGESAFGEALPKRLAFDRDGHLYFVSNADHTIRRFDRATGILSRVSGQPGATSQVNPLGNDGPAAAASFRTPLGIAISSDNRLFISDTENHQIRLIHL
ncbi:NHL repeat protein [compost metagenome]